MINIHLRRDQRLSDREKYGSNEVKIFAPSWVEQGLFKLAEHLKGCEASVYDNEADGKPCKKPCETFPVEEALSAGSLSVLQKVARNEILNVTGRIDESLFRDVKFEVILSIRDLVRQTIIAGPDYSSSCGGYKCKKQQQERQRVYICDLAALQFQKKYNTGRLVLIDKDSKNTFKGVLDDFIFENVVGEKKKSFEEVEIAIKKDKTDQLKKRYGSHVGHDEKGKKSCYIDRKAYACFVKEDVALYGIAISKIVKEFYPEDKIHLKFLKYGTGFFAGKFSDELERLITMAVLEGLESILKREEIREIIGKIELPFYSLDKKSGDKLRELKKKFQIDIAESSDDALKKSDQEGLIIATTTCGDNHASCGNEMGSTSVHSAIAENLESKGNLFCPNINTEMGEEYINLKEEVKKPEPIITEPEPIPPAEPETTEPEPEPVKENIIGKSQNGPTTMTPQLSKELHEKLNITLTTKPQKPKVEPIPTEVKDKKLIRPETSDRFSNSADELILVNVDEAITKVYEVINDCANKNAHLKEIRDTTAYKKAREIYELKKRKIKSVAQDKKALQSFTKDDIRNVNIALIAYTVEDPLYYDFNAKTRQFLAGELQDYPYRFYLAHLFFGTSYFNGKPTSAPAKLYRGINNSTDHLEVDQVFAFPHIVSATARMDIAMEFTREGGTIFVLLLSDSVIDGIGMKYHSQYPAEEEFLLAPTHSYKVKHIHTEKVEGRKIVEVSVIRGKNIKKKK